MAISIQQTSIQEQWQQIVTAATLPPITKEYLIQCQIKEIIVSQAEKAWDIYFQSPLEPENEVFEQLSMFWQQIFGFHYQPRFHYIKTTQYQNLEILYEQCWENILHKLSLSIPSCRGFMSDAKFRIEENQFEIVINQELGFNYLLTHGVKQKLEKIFTEEYQLKVQVSIILEECLEELDNQLQALENQYRERFMESLEKHSANEISTVVETKKDTVIMGKKICGSPVELQKIIEEEKSVIVCGYIFNLERRTLKTDRVLITFAISDKTDSIACKIIADSAVAVSVLHHISEKNWYLLRGSVQIDRYTQELTFFPRDIMETEVEGRRDEAEEKRVELHLHTKMSTLDGLVGIKELIKRLVSWGHSAVAVTDHGVVQAFPEIYEAARGKDIRIIYGVEGYLYDHQNQGVHGKKPTYHCILLATNAEGLRNLYELVTISHLDHFYRVPRIPKRELERLRKGLLIGSACEAGELIRHYLQGADIHTLEEIASFYDYLEIQPRGNNQFLIANGTLASEEELLQMNKTIYEIGKKLNKPVVATGDVHFLDPEDEVYRRILMTGKGFEDADNQAPLYLKTTQEMLAEFAYLGPEACKEVVIINPQQIASMIEDLKPIPDKFFPPEIEGAEEEVTRLTLSKASELYGNPLPEIVKKQIDKELNSIISNGFAVLYLIAHKLVKKSNEDGYLVGSRGSVGSSLVATLCGITEVNPLPPHYRCPKCQFSEFFDDGSVACGANLPDKNCPHCQEKMIKDGHHISFEVFLGFKGDKVPDIDLNFSGEYQPQAHKYTEELFGRENVFRAGTIATVATKTAFGFVKNYYSEKGIALKTPELNRIVDGCTGVKRTTGQHPGGVMVLPKGLDIHHFTPIQRPADDINSETITTHFDYHAISSRLVKLDILGHDDPTVIKMLEDLTGVDCKTIPFDEPKVLSLFQSTEALGIKPKDLGTKLGTLGIPEFGTKFVRQMLEDTKPVNFSDLVRICGLSHGTDVWINNAQELVREGQATVSEIISARDDIMVYLIYKGLNPSKAFKIMESVRKGQGVNQEDVLAMKAHNVPDWYIESCQKIKYMFPKAHAVAYVMMAFRIAYFKVYYPLAFYASFFTVRADEFDADIVVGGIPAIKKAMEEIQKKGNEATQKDEKLYNILELALEMYLRNITLKRVDLWNSDSNRFIISQDQKALLPPFVSLQGLGQSAATNIVQAREEKLFTSKEDLRLRGKVNKSVMEVLEKHGCLENLAENDQISLF